MISFFPVPSPRRAGKRIGARALRLSELLKSLIVVADRAMIHTVAARDAEQIAWSVLCDRGWPASASLDAVSPAVVEAWASAWAEYAALPVNIASPRELVRRRRIQRRLHRSEVVLRSELPSQIWDIVGEGDEAGRAALAFILEAVGVCLAAKAHAEACTVMKKNARVCLALLAHQAGELGLAPPSAPLDVDGWRRVAADALVMSTRLLGTTAA